MSTAVALTTPTGLAIAAPPAILAALPASLLPVAAAYYSPEPPARQFVYESLAAELVGIIQHAALVLGQKAALTTEADTEAFAEELAGLLQRDFPHLRVAEVGEAFRRGASGAYRAPSDVDYIALPVFRRWLIAYAEGVRWEIVKAAAAEENRQHAEAAAANARDLTTTERLHYAFQVLRGGRLHAECHYMTPAVFGWLWEWHVIREFHPAGTASVKAWYDHLEKVTAGKIRLELRTEKDADLKHGDSIQKITALLRGESVAFDEDIDNRLKKGMRRLAVGAFAASLTDLSNDGLRGMLTDAAAAHAIPSTPTPPVS